MSGELQRQCPVCGAGESQPHLQKMQLRLVRCTRCGMVYANPVPMAYATGDYYNLEGSNYYLSPDKLESDYSPVRFARELALFRSYCQSGTVLDVGCSSGAFLFQLTTRFKKAYEAVGTDVSGPPLDYAESRGVMVRRGPFLEQDWDGKRFDAITFWAVLEHLIDPAAFLDKAAELLKPGGLCFVLVPNFKSLATRVLGSNYRYIYGQHLNYFTEETLTTFVRRRFSLLQITSTHFNPIVIWQDWRNSGREVANVDRATLLQRTTSMKTNPWLTPIRWGYRGAERLLSGLTLADNLAAVLVRP